MRFDLHIHSQYSYDSVLKPEKILKIAKKRNLDGLAVTDHNTIQGGIKTFSLNKDPDFEVIIGSEIKTEYGDIIGIFLNEEIRSKSFEIVIEEIKDQGGFTILAHPYRQLENPEIIASKVDLIEIFNARSRKKWNENAYKLSKLVKKPVTAGSDSHTHFEIAKGTITSENGFNGILKKKVKVEGMESNYYFAHGMSVLLEKIKKTIN